MSIARVTPLFSAAFALIYVVAVERNLAAVTYHPRTGVWDLWTQPAVAASSPAMYWYGWMITALVGAVAVSAIALPLVRDREPPAWIGWAIPLAVMVSFLYFLRSFFIY
jgi:hypothetical protein